MTLHSLNPKPKKRVFLRFATIAAVFFFAWGVWSMYSLVKVLPDPGRLSDRAIAQSTKIYDRTGEVLLYEIHGEEKRTVVPLDRIPQTVQQATLTAEDIHFYSHPGLDIRGIFRALVVNISRGSISQGGSTITQQLVKNSILSSERTWSRKLKEAILAVLIERRFTKNEILELYLNQIPYGSNAYGVQAAAQTYFSKNTDELTLAEAATLAALPKAPSYYWSHKEDLTERKEWILDRMAEAGFASPEDAAKAKKEELIFATPAYGITAPHFVMNVREYLDEKYGKEFVEAGGLTVITTLDAQLQEHAETVIREGSARNEKLVYAKNAALVAIDPQTGDVLAMVGSRDYRDVKNDGNVNVTLRPRQPGSAFKPFVYATAFKKGYTPNTVLFDVFTEFNVKCNPDGSPGSGIANPRECYHPKNYDDMVRGPVSLRTALAQSLNIPAVKLLYLAGISDSIRTAQDLGISTLTNPKRYGLSLVLGGGEVTLFEMTSALGAFGQDGVRHPPRSILQVKNAEGEILEHAKESSIQAIDTEVARAINDILSDNDARVPAFSPSSALHVPGRTVAVKTGTSQDYRDAWTIGYSNTITAGVWVGNNDNSSMSQDSISVMIAAPLWRQFMDGALKERPAVPFSPHALPLAQKPVLQGHYRTGEIVKIDKLSRKLATAFTPPELVEEISFGHVRTILASVQKEDPLGPPPANPENDPQYRNWQAGIDMWLASYPLPDLIPPTEYDDTHSPDKEPRVIILFPQDESIRAETVREIVTEIEPQFPLQEVQLFFNDELIHTQTGFMNPGRITFVLSNPPPSGPLAIKIVVYDQMRNKGVAERRVVIQ